MVTRQGDALPGRPGPRGVRADLAGGGPMDPGTPDEEWREDCAPRRALEIFSAKWTSMALHALHARHGGAARTGALARSLPGISNKMLT